MAALAQGDCAFWITADQVVEEECSEDIDALLNRRIWAHQSSSGEPSPPSTLEAIASSLPNGFHDAHLRELILDLPHREVQMVLDLWVGDMEAPPGPDREQKRRAELTLSDLACWMSEGIFLDRDLLGSSGLRIDMGLCEPGHKPEVPPSLATAQAPISWLFCEPLNTLSFFSAGSASLLWIEGRPRGAHGSCESFSEVDRGRRAAHRPPGPPHDPFRHEGRRMP